MELNWLIICYKDLDEDDMDVVHLCAYENEPSEIDFKHLQDELATDEEFEMIGDTDYKMKLLNREEHSEWFDYFCIPENSNELPPGNYHKEN